MKVSLDLYNFIQKALISNTIVPNDLLVREGKLIYGQSKIYYERGNLGDYPDELFHCEPVYIRHKLTEEMKNYLPSIFAKAVLNNSFVPEYPNIKKGDIVINKDNPNSCDIRIVEQADKDTISLVNGKQDLVYQLPHEAMCFWKEWKILCKYKNREDVH